MNHLPAIDLWIIALYLGGMIVLGFVFSRKNTSPDQFTKASGKIPSWAVGISIYATFLSSNTFLGVPGKSFGTNWNAFVFSLSMPLAAWIGAKYFVPFYRRVGDISAYTHLEKRFGPWARTYAVVCFLLTQLARMGSVFFGIALTLQALTGYSMPSIIIVMGAIIIVYTVLGGMEAVIWTEVAQGLIKTMGALLILFYLFRDVAGGPGQILQTGMEAHKFSLGTLRPDFTITSFWVILLYGFFMNLNNFGMDQNYVQRYQATGGQRQATRSLWLCVKLYIPVSLMFFLIGTSLFCFYQQHPEMLQGVRMQAATERLGSGASSAQVSALAARLQPSDYGDKVLPEFMIHYLPRGIVGLIISALLSAAMSTISSGMNASATVFTFDIYRRYFKPGLSPRATMRMLLSSTLVVGILAVVCGIAMVGVKSILDLWWALSGIFAAGMLGLFLLGIANRRVQNPQALVAVGVGLGVIAWMSLSYLIPDSLSMLRSSLHVDMVIVVGTVTIFGVGSLLARNKPDPGPPVESAVQAF